MNRFRVGVALLAICLIVLAWNRVLAVRSGLIWRPLVRDGVPMSFFAPASATNVPGVLIAHGFAGSRQLMLGYAYVLAHAGYGVLLWDFDGHGTSPAPLDREGETLLANVDVA